MISLFHVGYMKQGHFTENGEWGSLAVYRPSPKLTVNGLRLETDRHSCTNDACEGAFKRYTHSRTRCSRNVPDKWVSPFPCSRTTVSSSKNSLCCNASSLRGSLDCFGLVCCDWLGPLNCCNWTCFVPCWCSLLIYCLDGAMVHLSVCCNYIELSRFFHQYMYQISIEWRGVEPLYRTCTWHYRFYLPTILYLELGHTYGVSVFHMSNLSQV